jgi:predicted PurR-regulated permease PerM
MLPEQNSPPGKKALIGQLGIARLLERAVILALFIALLVGVVFVLKPFFTAILVAAILVIATWPLHEWLARRGMSATGATLILTLATLLCFVAPLVLVAPQLTGHVIEFVRQIARSIETAPPLPAWLVHFPYVGAKLDESWVRMTHGQLWAVLSPYAASFRRSIVELGGAAGEAVVQLLMSVVISIMIWQRADVLTRFFGEASLRFAGSFGTEALRTAVTAIRSVSYGILGTAAAQAAALTIGLIFAGIPSAGLLGFLALIIALSQTGILLTFIWGGAAWWLYSEGHYGPTIFMIVWGLAVSIADNIIRPFLVGKTSSMPMSLVFLGVFGGFISFGILGMFIGPTLLSIFLTLIQAWRRSAVVS